MFVHIPLVVILYAYYILKTLDHCGVISTKWFRFYGDIVDLLLIRLISWLVGFFSSYIKNLLTVLGTESQTRIQSEDIVLPEDC